MQQKVTISFSKLYCGLFSCRLCLPLQHGNQVSEQVALGGSRHVAPPADLKVHEGPELDGLVHRVVRVVVGRAPLGIALQVVPASGTTG